LLENEPVFIYGYGQGWSRFTPQEGGLQVNLQSQKGPGERRAPRVACRTRRRWSKRLDRPRPYFRRVLQRRLDLPNVQVPALNTTIIDDSTSLRSNIGLPLRGASNPVARNAWSNVGNVGGKESAEKHSPCEQAGGCGEAG
jgi:hypothetical protein